MGTEQDHGWCIVMVGLLGLGAGQGFRYLSVLSDIQVCGFLCGFSVEIRVKRLHRVTLEYTCDLGKSNT